MITGEGTGTGVIEAIPNAGEAVKHGENITDLVILEPDEAESLHALLSGDEAFDFDLTGYGFNREVLRDSQRERTLTGRAKTSLLAAARKASEDDLETNRERLAKVEPNQVIFGLTVTPEVLTSNQAIFMQIVTANRAIDRIGQEVTLPVVEAASTDPKAAFNLFSQLRSSRVDNDDLDPWQLSASQAWKMALFGPQLRNDDGSYRINELIKMLSAGEYDEFIAQDIVTSEDHAYPEGQSPILQLARYTMAALGSVNNNGFWRDRMLASRQEWPEASQTELLAQRLNIQRQCESVLTIARQNSERLLTHITPAQAHDQAAQLNQNVMGAIIQFYGVDSAVRAGWSRGDAVAAVVSLKRRRRGAPRNTQVEAPVEATEVEKSRPRLEIAENRYSYRGMEPTVETLQAYVEGFAGKFQNDSEAVVEYIGKVLDYAASNMGNPNASGIKKLGSTSRPVFELKPIEVLGAGDERIRKMITKYRIMFSLVQQESEELPSDAPNNPQIAVLGIVERRNLGTWMRNSGIRGKNSNRN